MDNNNLKIELPNFSNDIIPSVNIITDNNILGSGDVKIIKNFLDEDFIKELYNEMMNIDFQQWYHMPSGNKKPLPLKRIKRILAEPNLDGSIPYYRFTVNDQSSHGIITKYPPILKETINKINELVGMELNHIVVLLYRDGNDSIGFHKDKTLDLDDNAPIVSLSLGAKRTYCLRDDIFNPIINQEVQLENNTLLILGPKTNQDFYHSIKQEESTDQRISITFRKTLTNKLEDGTLVGKGEKYQTLDWPEELKGKHIKGYTDNIYT